MYCSILECWQCGNCVMHEGDFMADKQRSQGDELVYAPPRRHPVRLTQNPNGSGEIGSIVYMGSVVLALCCDLDIIDFQDKTVLELGSGCGLAGAVLGLRSRCKSLVVSEIPTVLPILEQNLQDIYLRQGKNTNEVPECAAVWWGETASQAVNGRTFDIIVGADVVYEVERASELLRTLCDLSREDTKIYIVYSERYATTFFFEEVCPPKFAVEHIDPTTVALLKGLALTSMTPTPGFLSWYPYRIAVLTKLPSSEQC